MTETIHFMTRNITLLCVYAHLCCSDIRDVRKFLESIDSRKENRFNGLPFRCSLNGVNNSILDDLACIERLSSEGFLTYGGKREELGWGDPLSKLVITNKGLGDLKNLPVTRSKEIFKRISLDLLIFSTEPSINFMRSFYHCFRYDDFCNYHHGIIFTKLQNLFSFLPIIDKVLADAKNDEECNELWKEILSFVKTDRIQKNLDLFFDQILYCFDVFQGADKDSLISLMYNFHEIMKALDVVFIKDDTKLDKMIYWKLSRS